MSSLLATCSTRRRSLWVAGGRDVPGRSAICLEIAVGDVALVALEGVLRPWSPAPTDCSRPRRSRRDRERDGSLRLPRKLPRLLVGGRSHHRSRVRYEVVVRGPSWLGREGLVEV